MHGSSWFEPDGQWSEWDVTGALDMIASPALVIGGAHDQCIPELAQVLAAGIPKAELAILEAAHLPFFEVPDEYLRLVGDFLTRVETGR